MLLRCPFPHLWNRPATSLFFLFHPLHKSSNSKKFPNRDSQKLPPQDVPVPLHLISLHLQNSCPTSIFILFFLLLTLPPLSSPLPPLSPYFHLPVSFPLLSLSENQEPEHPTREQPSVVGVTTWRWHTLHMTAATLKTCYFVHFGFSFNGILPLSLKTWFWWKFVIFISRTTWKKLIQARTFLQFFQPSEFFKIVFLAWHWRFHLKPGSILVFGK